MPPNRSPIPLHFAMLTDPGLCRSGNEDACAASTSAHAFVVCDGMGGAAAGEIASRLAVDTFLNRMEQPATSSVAAASSNAAASSIDAASSVDAATSSITATSSIAPATSIPPASRPQTRLHAAILAANAAIRSHAGQSRDLSGMGTTLISLLHVPGPTEERRSIPRSTSRSLPPATLFLANVGDSRCYRRRSGDLLQLSVDHSFVEEQIRSGQITPEQAATSPMRNYITRAVGSHPQVVPDIQSFRPLSGDLYLLATDGLTRELTDRQIADLLNASVPDLSLPGDHPATEADLQIACRALVQAANANGGRDNITVLLLLFA